MNNKIGIFEEKIKDNELERGRNFFLLLFHKLRVSMKVIQPEISETEEQVALLGLF